MGTKIPSSMRKEVTNIISGLTSQSHSEIGNSLTALDSYLGSFVSSVVHLRLSQTIDSKLSAFLSLQDSFQYNLASALLDSYQYFDRFLLLVSKDHLLLANQCMCGILLLHSDLRRLFQRKCNLAIIISLLETRHPLCLPEVCTSVLTLLVHILTKSAPNLRIFEAMNGCKIVSQHLQIHFSDSETQSALEELSLKVVEFFIFYLTDEAGLDGEDTRSVEQKVDFLRPDFPEIDALRKNLEKLSSIASNAEAISIEDSSGDALGKTMPLDQGIRDS